MCCRHRHYSIEIIIERRYLHWSLSSLHYLVFSVKVTVMSHSKCKDVSMHCNVCSSASNVNTI